MDKTTGKIKEWKMKAWIIAVIIGMVSVGALLGTYMVQGASDEQLSEDIIKETDVSTDNEQQETTAGADEQQDTMDGADESSADLEVGSDDQMDIALQDDTPINATIHTYSGETFQISGMIEKYLAKDESADPIMEVSGTMESHRPEEGQENKEAEFPAGDPLSMTVYTPTGEIYGFHTYHEVKLDQQQEASNLELYGYLVGYYDGEEYHS